MTPEDEEKGKMGRRQEDRNGISGPYVIKNDSTLLSSTKITLLHCPRIIYVALGSGPLRRHTITIRHDENRHDGLDWTGLGCKCYSSD